MRRPIVIAGAAVCLLVAMILFAPGPAAATEVDNLGTDDLWWDGFAPHGVVGPATGGRDGSIHAAIVHQGSLIVSGWFEHLDGVPVTNFARWTGETWEPLDTSVPPIETAVWATYDGSLLAGAYLLNADGTNQSCLYRQTAEGWESFGPEVLRQEDSWVTDIEVDGNDLYVMARRYTFDLFWISSEVVVTHWDGSSWEEIDFEGSFSGEWEADPDLYDAEVFQGDLYFAGDFRLNESDSTGHIARWTGTGLELVGGGANERVSCLAVFDGRLFAGGRFSEAGATTTGPLAAWDGESWTAMGDRFGAIEGTPSVSKLCATEEKLYAYGRIELIDTIRTSHLVTWDGGSWAGSGWYWDDSILGNGLMIPYAGGLIYGGELRVGARGYEGFARWDGADWTPLSERGITLNGPPSAFLPTDGGLVVAGEFTLPGIFASTQAIARWDDHQWSFLAENIAGSVFALAEHDGRLVAGGSFDRIDGVDADYIAYWDGGQWRQLGNGMDDYVSALEVYDGDLVAGGRFRRAGSRSAELVAVWNGRSWNPMDQGLHGTESAYVRDLEVYGGKLVAAGKILWAGSRAIDHVAEWDGRSWSPMGSMDVFATDLGFSILRHTYLRQVVRWKGRLVVRGRFNRVMGRPANSLATWDGEIWEPLEPLLIGDVDVIGVHQDRLVVGGRARREADHTWVGMILQHDGDRWLTMGSGLTQGSSNFYQDDVYALATWRDRLFVGGAFDVAGRKLSSSIARWDGMALAPPAAAPLHAAPNPTRESAVVSYRLDDPGPVVVRVFDVQGRQVATLREGFMPGGDHTETWDLRDRAGRRVTAGMYFIRVMSPFTRATQKIVVVP